MSTLQVENLIGPTSGSNTNKVIIPSGQTLDASGATLLPSSGQIIQTVQYLRSGSVGSSSSSRVDVSTSAYTDIMFKSISTTMANCQLRVMIGMVGYNSSSALRGSIKIYRDSTIIDGDTYGLWSTAGTMNNYILDHIDSPSASAGTTLTYKIQGNNSGSSTMMYLYTDGGGGSSNHITLQEIAG